MGGGGAGAREKGGGRMRRRMPKRNMRSGGEGLEEGEGGGEE